MRKRITIIRPGALGDTLMLLPSIIYLRTRHHINIVGRYPGLEYIKTHVNQCLDYDRGGWHNLYIKDNPEALHSIMPESDMIGAFVSDPQGVVKNNLKKLFKDIPTGVFPPVPDEEIHTSMHIARSLNQMGITIDPATCIEDFMKKPLISGEGSGQDKNVIVFHPGSGGNDKNYPPEFWLKLLDVFIESGKAGNKVMTVLLGPAEDKICDLFNKLERLQIRVLFCPGSDEIWDLFKSACIFIGHDSGMTHLAAMHGVPTVALFRNSSVIRWRPLGPNVKMFKKDDNLADLLKEVFEYAIDFK